MRPFRCALLLAAAGLLSACADDLSTAAHLQPRLASGAAGPQVVLNEAMADPNAVTDGAGEWIEVHNWGASAVDLQGWVIASGNDSPHTIGSSLSVPAGGYVVLARNGSKSKNGGVSVQYVYGTAITLANGSDWLALRDPSGATVDSATWATAMPAGASRGTKDPSAENTDV